MVSNAVPLTRLASVLAVQFNWEAAFYIVGGFCCLWYVIWINMARDSMIEERTRRLIALGGSPQLEPFPLPWRWDCLCSQSYSAHCWSLLLQYLVLWGTVVGMCFSLSTLRL